MRSRPYRRGPDPVGYVAMTTNPQMGHQIRKDRRVIGLARAEEHDQWSTLTVNEVMDLRAQPAAGAANTVIRRLDRQIRVIRPSPQCRG